MSAGGDEGVCGGGEGEPRPGGQLGCPVSGRRGRERREICAACTCA